MNKKLWALSVVIPFTIILVIVTNWNIIFPPKGLAVADNQTVNNFKDSLQNNQPIKENDWVFFASIKPEDSLNVLKVTYQEKYGLEKEIYCTAVFENKKTGEYKCIAPWMPNHVLQKSNLISFDPKEVSKKEMPN
jgi:hypothetical protein